jgi:Lrp/AsnC family transcriptional regulator for asnA, asnC and gidA
LLRDPRLPSSRIARELSVPDATVRYRVRRLKAAGRIQSMTMPTRREPIRATFFVGSAPGKTDDLIETLSELECVVFVAIGSGPYDLCVHGVFQNEDEFLRFRNRTLGGSDQVTGLVSLQWVKVVTRRYGWTGSFLDADREAPVAADTQR